MAMKCPHILPITKMWMWTNLLTTPFLQHPSYYEMWKATGQQQSKGLSDKQPTIVHYLLDCNFSTEAKPIIAQFLHK